MRTSAVVLALATAARAAKYDSFHHAGQMYDVSTFGGGDGGDGIDGDYPSEGPPVLWLSADEQSYDVLETGDWEVGDSYEHDLNGDTPTFYYASGLDTAFAPQHGLDHLFVAEYYNNAVRQIDVATGHTTVLAGHGFDHGYYIDGIGTNAFLKYPRDVAYDIVENAVYTAEGCAIRKIDVATATVSKVVGQYGVDDPECENDEPFEDGDNSVASVEDLSGITLHHATRTLYAITMGTACLRVVDLETYVTTSLVAPGGECGGTEETESIDGVVGVAATFGGVYSVEASLEWVYFSEADLASNGMATLRRYTPATNSVLTLLPAAYGRPAIEQPMWSIAPVPEEGVVYLTQEWGVYGCPIDELVDCAEDSDCNLADTYALYDENDPENDFSTTYVGGEAGAAGGPCTIVSGSYGDNDPELFAEGANGQDQTYTVLRGIVYSPEHGSLFVTEFGDYSGTRRIELWDATAAPVAAPTLAPVEEESSVGEEESSAAGDGECWAPVLDACETLHGDSDLRCNCIATAKYTACEGTDSEALHAAVDDAVAAAAAADADFPCGDSINWDDVYRYDAVVDAATTAGVMSAAVAMAVLLW